MRTFKQHLNEVSKKLLTRYQDAAWKDANKSLSAGKFGKAVKRADDSSPRGMAAKKLNGSAKVPATEETILDEAGRVKIPGTNRKVAVGNTERKLQKGAEKEDILARMKKRNDIMRSIIGNIKTPKNTVKNEDFTAYEPKSVKENYEGMEHMSDAAHELVLHADNSAQLHHGSHMPIINNLKKKVKKGVYDSEKAKKLWHYHADRAAQDYHKHYGDKSQPWHKMFTTHDRAQAAAHWEKHHRDELNESVQIDETAKLRRGSFYNS